MNLTTCAHCHKQLPSERRRTMKYCSGTCRQRAWTDAHRDQERQRSRQWYKTNRDLVIERANERARSERERDPESVRTQTRERMARWRAEHPDKARELSREHYEANASARREQARRRYASDPERFREQSRQWRKANPGQMNDQRRRRRAMQKGAAVVETIKLDVLFERDGRRCHLCRKKMLRKHASVDHLIPLSQGGDHSWVNVALAHHSCNARRGAGRVPAQLKLVS